MIACQIPYRDVFTAFSPLAGRPFAHLLSGGQQAASHWGGDWQMIVAAPATTLVVKGGEVFKDTACMGPVAQVSPFEVLAQILAARATQETLGQATLEGLALPVFQGGAIGHLNYEMAALIEPSLVLPRSAGPLPEMAFGFYDAVALFHANAGKAFLVGRCAAAMGRLAALLGGDKMTGPGLPRQGRFWASDDRTSYKRAVANCRAQILAGEIFQANISQQLRAFYPDASLRGLDTPSLLATQQEGSAAAFGALLQYEGVSVLSNSPERFFVVRAQGDGFKAIAEPVKGTRPRHKDEAQDRLVAAELLADEKDRAENIMIADLVRNDLSRVCEDHSIREEQICALESFAHVHHLVSRISGKLRKDQTTLDLLLASFPCGSITGAPKIRAMEVIAEIEQRPRGIYCGAIGFFDDRGGVDFSVPIRTAQLRQCQDGLEVSYGAGGGITIMSDPVSEYEETLDKAATFANLTGCDVRALERGA